MDQPRPHAAKPCEQAAVRVAAVGTNAVAGLQAKREQAPHHPIGRVIKRGVGPTPIGKHQGCFVPEALGGALSCISNCVPNSVRDLGFDHGDLFPIPKRLQPACAGPDASGNMVWPAMLLRKPDSSPIQIELTSKATAQTSKILRRYSTQTAATTYNAENLCNVAFGSSLYENVVSMSVHKQVQSGEWVVIFLRAAPDSQELPDVDRREPCPLQP